MGISSETADGGGAEKMVLHGGGPVAGEGIDEVLQLEEGMGEVRHGPKEVDEGGTGELIRGERNGGAAARRRCGSSGLVGRARTQGRRERGRRVTGCSSTLAREDKRGKKGGDGAPFIGDAAGWGMGCVQRHAAARHGGRCGANAAVWRCGVAGSVPATALAGGALVGAV
jgi:hypothetical protein